MNPEQTVLYKYDGNDKLVVIPDTVEIIANNAFEIIGDNVRGISLSANLEKVNEDAFSGADSGENIIYIYDADTEQSEKIGKLLDDKYEQFVHSVYLDVDDVEEIAGINFGNNTKEVGKTEDFSNIEELYDAGINEFVFDFSTLDAKYIPILLNKFFLYIQNVK